MTIEITIAPDFCTGAVDAQGDQAEEQVNNPDAKISFSVSAEFKSY
jgi:hypothetical protein